jgi:hypothetical protein
MLFFLFSGTVIQIVTSFVFLASTSGKQITQVNDGINTGLYSFVFGQCATGLRVMSATNELFSALP